jgi:hypothetical protein
MPRTGGHGTLLTKVTEMAMWALICANCKTSFQYSEITEVELAQLFLPEKPLASDGQKCECPGCGHVALYQRHDLRYRRN